MQDIYVGDTGKGFPLVLVHGFLGSSKMWEPQIEFLKKIIELLLQIYHVLAKAIKLNHIIIFMIWHKQS